MWGYAIGLIVKNDDKSFFETIIFSIIQLYDLCDSEGEDSEFNNILNGLIDMRQCVSLLDDEYQILFWSCILGALSIETFESIYAMIDERLCDNPEIKRAKLIFDMKNGKQVNFFEITKFLDYDCDGALIVAYLNGTVNRDYILSLIDIDYSVLDLSLHLFVYYIETLFSKTLYAKARDVLVLKSNIYGQTFEYMCLLCSCNFSLGNDEYKNQLDKIKFEHKHYESISFKCYFDLGLQLSNYNMLISVFSILTSFEYKLSLLQRVITSTNFNHDEQHCLIGKVSNDMIEAGCELSDVYYYRGKFKFYEKKYQEALVDLTNSFSKREMTDCAFTIAKIYSIQGNYSISKEVEYLKDIKNSEVQLLISDFYFKNNHFDIARNCIIKSIIMNQAVGSFVKYMEIMINYNSPSDKIDTVDRDTHIALKCISNNKIIEICIFDDKLKCKDFRNVNIGDSKVYFENDADVENLRFEKINSMCTFKGEKYIIQSIESIDKFIFACAIAESVKNGNVQVITIGENQPFIELQNYLSGVNKGIDRAVDEFYDKGFLPVAMMSHCLGRTLLGSYLFIFNNTNKKWVNNLRHNDHALDRVIIAHDTILILQKLGVAVEELNDKMSCFISRVTFNKLKNDIKLKRQELNNPNIIGTISCVDKQLVGYSSTVKDKQSMLQYLNNLERFLCDIEVVDTRGELDIDEKIKSVLLEYKDVIDIDIIRCAQENDACILSDNEFVNVLCNLHGLNSVGITNVISQLTNNSGEYNVMVQTLAKINMNRFISVDTLIYYTTRIDALQSEVEKEQEMEKFVEILTCEYDNCYKIDTNLQLVCLQQDVKNTNLYINENLKSWLSIKYDRIINIDKFS